MTTTLTFHSFRRLPWELREQIWTLATRPDRPAAHYFTAFDASNDNEFSTLQSYAVKYKLPRQSHLAAPRRNKSDIKTISWTTSNSSIYLTDSGLWTACKESRDIMEKRFGPHFKPEHFDSPKIEWQPDVPVTGSFKSNGETQCFTVQPNKDLFCLQPYNFDTVNWGGLFGGNGPLMVDWRDGFVPKHVAIEFDPKHDYSIPPMPTTPKPMLPENIVIHEKYNRKFTKCFEEAALMLWSDMHLWIIDTSLKRRPWVPLKEEDDRYTFHTSSGRYVEVAWHDQAWDGDDSIDIEWGYAYMLGLQEYLDEMCEENSDEFWGKGLEFGILAYEAPD